MIYIGNPAHGMDPRFTVAPGGFAWWYVDVVTPEGDGLVLIWSYGLPFLPGYARAARAGRAARPLERPSLNVVVYRAGRPVTYLLQEYGGRDAEVIQGLAVEAGRVSGAPAGAPVGGAGAARSDRPRPRRRATARVGTAESAPFADRAHVAGEEAEAGVAPPPALTLRLGDSWFRSRVEDGRQRVEVEIDCPLPGTRERLRGTVRVDGAARLQDRGAGADPPDEPHVWTPLTGPAQGEVALRLGDRQVARFTGRAYHDRNGGSVPLHGLGMDSWMWGRIPFRDHEAIYYLLWPHGSEQPGRCIGLEVDRRGETRQVEELRLEVDSPRRTLAGLRWSERLRLLQGDRPWLDVRHTALIDSGPFYLRFFSEARSAGGERATGVGELCYPERVDLAVHRPFVRMKVHRVDGGNSAWLPLFTGPRHGRVARLFRHLLPRRTH